jgi:hypothetical protein
MWENFLELCVPNILLHVRLARQILGFFISDIRVNPVIAVSRTGL